MQVQVLSGGGRGLLLTRPQSEDSGAEREMGVKLEATGSETSVQSGKLDRKEAGKASRVVDEHRQEGASIRTLEMQVR